jgi:hypothetical protein
MRVRHLLLAAVLGVASRPSAALAGMPSPVLSDWAELRFETISFFVVLLLIFTAVIRWLWNYLAKDFPALPRLGYRKTLAGVVLVGLLLAVVLTMIAGARELLTPGAWQKQGVLYKVAAPPATPAPSPPVDIQQLDQRKERLGKLKTALWQYAAQHDGHFPKDNTSSEIEPTLWELPSAGGTRYFYVPGLKTDQSPNVLVYEPNVLGDAERLALRTDGEIVVLSTAELRKQLSKQQP